MSRRQEAWSVAHAVTVTAGVAWRGTRWGTQAVTLATEFADFVGYSFPLDKVNLTTLDRWTAALEQRGLSPASVNRHLAAVSKVFTVAVDRGGVATRPKFPRRRETAGRVRFLTPGEETDMLSLFPDGGEQDLFRVLIDTGLRMGEAMSLEWRDVDFDTGLIAVWHTKNNQPRSVPMTKRVRAVLEYRKSEDAAKLGRVQRTVFSSRYRFRREWDKAKHALGLDADKAFVPHSLRHTCASRLVQRGVPLKVVQEWLGHKSIIVTMRYAHLSPDNLRAAVSVLEDTK